MRWPSDVFSFGLSQQSMANSSRPNDLGLHVNIYAALFHYFFEVSIRHRVAQLEEYREQDFG